jgi:hypothetical protein
MQNLSVETIGQYLLYVLLCILMSFFAIVSFISLGYSALNKIIEPSFDLNSGRRWLDLIFSYLIFSVLFVISFELLLKHFNIHAPRNSQAPLIFFPPVIYLLTRGTVRFLSARIAKDFLLSILFLILVGISMMMIFRIIGIVNELDYHIDSTSLILLCLMGIPTVFLGDIALYYLPLKMKLVRDNYVKDRRLIDLTEKMPVEIETVVGIEQIDQKITNIITQTRNTIKIITKGYTTIYKNFAAFTRLLNRRLTGEEITIMIIGTTVEDEKMFKNKHEQETVKKTLSDIREVLPKLHICECKFDKIRLILRDSQEAIITFSTGNIEKSHIGFYSTHPLFISLLEGYFDTKCKTLPCPDPCKKDCRGLPEDQTTDDTN